MSITEKIEKEHKNCIENIKKMKNGKDKDMAIGALISDLGSRSISAISRALNHCRAKIRKCRDNFTNGTPITTENRGRKSIEEKYPNLKNDIELVIEKYKNVDSHFKSENLYISISPKTIIEELITNHNYPEKFTCYNTISRILKDMNYKFKKIAKIKVLGKIDSTDAIFENVNNAMESALESDNKTAVASIDDKATKIIGNVSDNGKSWVPLEALDHDTTFDYKMKPFGILDIKTNETFVTCTPYYSTAEFKVYCLEKYIEYKLKTNPLEKLIIFLDNGPENSGRRKLWLKKLVELSIKYKIIIELVYYPPYHSKYNKIERFWARLQIFWNRIIMDSTDKLLNTLNTVTWKGVKCKGDICWTHYQKGIIVTDLDLENNIDPHLIREQNLENYSITITPYTC